MEVNYWPLCGIIFMLILVIIRLAINAYEATGYKKWKTPAIIA